MKSQMAGSTRWRSLSLAEIAREVIAFGVGVAVAVSLALTVSPEPEKIGRVGLGLIVAMLLAATPLVFAFGFVAGEATRRSRVGWSRTAWSALCGGLFVVGWLVLGWLFGVIHDVVHVPDAVGFFALFGYWLLGPLLLPILFSRLGGGREVKPAKAPAENGGS